MIPVPESELSVNRQSKSSIYHLLDHPKFENQNIPLNPNLILFNDRQLEIEYNRELYLDDTSNRISEEFRMVLIYFYVALTLILITLLCCSILLNGSSELSYTQMWLNICMIAFLLISYYSVLYLMKLQTKIIIMNRIIFTGLGILTNTYLILFDKKILCTILKENYSPSQLPLEMILIGFTYIIRTLLLDSYIHYFVIVIHAIVFYFAINLVYSPLNLSAILSSAALVLFLLFYKVVECHINSIRSRMIFWRKYSERISISNNIYDKDQDLNFETETEQLVFICEKVKTLIKNVSKAIIFKDIKSKLKEAVFDINKLKKIIGHGSSSELMMIENHVEDLEDREFISQNYRNASISSFLDSNRSKTYINLLEQKSRVLFPEYGVNELTSVLDSIGKNWSFDIWFVKETTGRSISIVGQYLFERYSLGKRFSIPGSVLERYLNSLEFHYRENPYHNACHGADVMHSFIYFVNNSEMHRFITPIETMSCIIAGLGHDVGHPGLTNRYLITTRDPMAIQYNDISVLESMHCSIVYKFLMDPEHNLFESLSNEDWITSRKIIIEMILSTDMSKHFEILGRFKTRALNLCDINLEKIDDKLLFFATGLKCADIGHSAKYTDLHQKWTAMVLEEFFKQGDLEKAKNIPVSMYCDRKTTNIPKSQAGFLINICLPLFESWARYINTPNINKTLEELKKNIDHWRTQERFRKFTQPPALEKPDQMSPQRSLAISNI